MRDELLFHYERELSFLRYMSGDFAKRYPKIAGRLLLESGKCEDPHVERLLEGFALLAARVYTKIDDEFPEVIESLFSVIYPHYLQPLPSASIVQFHLDPDQGKLMTGLSIPRESVLYSAPVGGVPCKFRTCYDATLWPIEVRAAEWRTPDRIQPPISVSNAVACVRLELQCLPDVTFDKLKLSTLRFFLQGDGTVVHNLIELLCNNTTQIVVRDLSTPALRTVTLPKTSLRQAGFAQDEAVVPFPRRSFWGYRLLEEYFAFPEKFCFLDLSGFERLAAAHFGNRIEILFYLTEFERADRRQMMELGISKNTFRLGCAPIVNLFDQISEPILVQQKKFEYRIVPDARRDHAMDIFSIDEVSGLMGASGEKVVYQPFYAYRHSASHGETDAFWYSTRRPAPHRANKGSEVSLTFIDLSGRRVTPDRDTVTVHLTCSNGELPARLPFGDEEGDFQLENGGPITRIVALTKPTDPVQPPAKQTLLWRLISQMSLNYLSLVSDGKDALREILRLHNLSGSLSGERQIDGILNIESAPHFARLTSDQGITFARGTRVELMLDEEQFAGTGAFTFSSVLDVFFGLYVSMNSFSQLVVRTRQRKRTLNQWPPRSGRKIVL